MKINVAVLLLVAWQAQAQSPVIRTLESGRKISIRGLSVVNDRVIWVSGTGGSVGRSTDAGNTFAWSKVAGYEKSDFRDIEAIDDHTALIMGITSPAVILKTTDAGQTWRKVFEDTSKGAFLDAMDLSIAPDSDTTLIVIGDPINGKILYAMSGDAGEQWSRLDSASLSRIPSLSDGEAFFASSGSNAALANVPGFAPPFWAASGGKSSNLWDLLYWNKYPLPIMQGKESTGANSLALNGNFTKGVVVGGDFMRDTISTGNCVLIDFGKTIQLSVPQTPPHGYRSCVIYITDHTLLACGTSGVDVSRDGGKNWQLVSRESFHVCKKARSGNAVFLAGNGGRVARFSLP